MIHNQCRPPNKRRCSRLQRLLDDVRLARLALVAATDFLPASRNVITLHAADKIEKRRGKKEKSLRSSKHFTRRLTSTSPRGTSSSSFSKSSSSSSSPSSSNTQRCLDLVGRPDFVDHATVLTTGGAGGLGPQGRRRSYLRWRRLGGQDLRRGEVVRRVAGGVRQPCPGQHHPSTGQPRATRLRHFRWPQRKRITTRKMMITLAFLSARRSPGARGRDAEVEEQGSRPEGRGHRRKAAGNGEMIPLAS